MTDDWIKRLEQLLDRHESAQTTLSYAVKQTKQTLVGLSDQVDRLESQLGRQHEELKTARERITGMKNDPVVLVRNYGAYREVYHSATKPCGWIGRSQHYDRLLLGEAKARGMRSCDSCGYRVRMEAEAA